MEKRNFIINTFTDWDEPPRARHQVAYALAKNYPVLFVNANRCGIPKYREIGVSDNLTIFYPYFPVLNKLRYRIPLLNRIYQNWLYKILRKQYPDSIIINFDFTARFLSSFFNKLVYYCNDDHVGMSYRLNSGWIARYHDRSEQKVIREASFCVGTSEFLTTRLGKTNRNSFEIRLGAPDTTDYQPFTNGKISGSETIQLGIVGYFDTVDLDIIEHISSEKDVFLTLVGPIRTPDKERLNRMSNVKATGKLTGDKLFDEISGFDVGLIPYKLDSNIDRTPNKLWLYLALGIPAVISNISGIKNWIFPDHFVYRADSLDDFYALSKQAALENNDHLMRERMEFAKQNSWDVRMKYFIELCDSLI